TRSSTSSSVTSPPPPSSSTARPPRPRRRPTGLVARSPAPRPTATASTRSSRRSGAWPVSTRCVHRQLTAWRSSNILELGHALAAPAPRHARLQVPLLVGDLRHLAGDPLHRAEEAVDLRVED